MCIFGAFNLFADSCVDGYEKGLDPKTIVEGFFERYFPDYSRHKSVKESCMPCLEDAVSPPTKSTP